MSQHLQRDARRDGGCCCFIIPPALLRRMAADPALDASTRRAMRESVLATERLRGLREAHRAATLRDPQRFVVPAPAHVPAQHLYDCQHRMTLPGTPVTAITGGYQTVFATTAKVTEFYKTILGRNSVDNKGADLTSSLHYGQQYDNAFWDGQQMVYGDGDGQMFTEMFLSPDVIGHELTHGVTQNESALQYEGESGALNESISDVFGAVFNQWLHQSSVTETSGWLIGAGILAAGALGKGYTCLRDMVQPSAAHCLSPQPELYGQLDPTADVHTNSGVPNKAFATFARALGGQAWTTAIHVWYDVCTNRQLRADARFSEFAALTVTAAGARGGAATAEACRAAWASVGVPGATA